MRRDENLHRSDEFCAKMLVDHLPVLAANLLYNDGLSRRTEAAAKEVRLRKMVYNLSSCCYNFVMNQGAKICTELAAGRELTNVSSSALAGKLHTGLAPAQVRRY